MLVPGVEICQTVSRWTRNPGRGDDEGDTVTVPPALVSRWCLRLRLTRESGSVGRTRRSPGDDKVNMLIISIEILLKTLNLDNFQMNEHE